MQPNNRTHHLTITATTTEPLALRLDVKQKLIFAPATSVGYSPATQANSPWWWLHIHTGHTNDTNRTAKPLCAPTTSSGNSLHQPSNKSTDRRTAPALKTSRVGPEQTLNTLVTSTRKHVFSRPKRYTTHTITQSSFQGFANVVLS